MLPKPIIIFFLLLSVKVDAQQVKITWQKIGTLPAEARTPHLGVAGAFVGVHEGVLVVAGGANFPDKMPWEGGRKVFHNSVYVFIKQKNALVPLKIQNTLSQRVAYGMSVSTPQGIVCVGGENENGGLTDAFLLKWNPQTHHLDQQALPNLPIPLSNALIAEKNGKIYVAGGETLGKTTDLFWLLDFTQTEIRWQKLPNLPMAVSHTAGGIQSNGDRDSFYLVGGRCKNSEGISTFYSNTYAFDFEKSMWTKKQPLPLAGLSAATSAAVSPNYLLVISGDEGVTFHQVERLNKAISIEKNDAKKQTLVLERNQLLNHHSGFRSNVWLYDTTTDRWHRLPNIPAKGQVTTTAVKWGQEIYIPSGEIRAGVRTPYIWRGIIH